MSAVSSSENSLRELSEESDIFASSCSAITSGEAYFLTYSVN